ncbi:MULTISPECIES: squalene/phytoene synthase family protein [unclassified Coleofasciculus]|uniref:squalene/phytoene synthase family protein n=1 Tax=unclassified Coleofasciculus TaxID=2692782 RepID=UPI00187F0C43|nr:MULTISPECIES: phytoene/squalene synthase family protein [unclassified Coleofasciculus]MBE9129050.1 phytoene/squalene synthase family protein [Coleofasciculus sp. LEGE 07081]MBE9151732.1 phytoene/squalene synthase family protein [Coleofasciculus sp. LEGE 07092]
MNSCKDALKVLKETSRTFYIPISRLPSKLQEAVASAYLCMRAIDEIEDHPGLDNPTKAKLLRAISLSLQAAVENFTVEDFSIDWGTNQTRLEEVTVRLGEWAILPPATIAPRVWDATAAMADRMAYWADRNWEIQTEADLNRYTFGVAGAVGLLLSDLWAWYDGTQTNRLQGIGFGRGLQAVNILRNRSDDLTRGIDFFPDGWSVDEMHPYSRRNLALADAYTNALPPGPALDFCRIPLALAHGTLNALALGKEKLSRSEVLSLIEGVVPVSG